MKIRNGLLFRLLGPGLVTGAADYLLEVVVPDLEHYQRFLVVKLRSLPIVREVRSNIAIQTLKAGGPLPLDHLAR